MSDFPESDFNKINCPRCRRAPCICSSHDKIIEDAIEEAHKDGPIAKGHYKVYEQSSDGNKSLEGADFAKSVEPYAKQIPMWRTPEPETIAALKSELWRARIKFPRNAHLTHALMEEVGELAKAELQGRHKAEI